MKEIPNGRLLNKDITIVDAEKDSFYFLRTSGILKISRQKIRKYESIAHGYQSDPKIVFSL